MPDMLTLPVSKPDPAYATTTAPVAPLSGHLLQEPPPLPVGVLTAQIVMPPEASPSLTLGDRTYHFSELMLADMLAVSGAILTELQTALDTGALDNDTLNFDVKNMGAVIRFFAKLIERAPSVAGQIAALMLNAKQPDDASYIIAHLTLADPLRIVEGFMDANAWEDIVESFFRLRTRLARAVARAKERHPTTS